MASKPIKRANGKWQIRWSFGQTPQSKTLDSWDDAELLGAWVTRLGNEVRDDDERITFGEYRYGVVGAAKLAEANRTWTNVVDEWLAKKKIEVGEDTYRGLVATVDRYTRNREINDWSRRPVVTMTSTDLNGLYFKIKAMPTPYTESGRLSMTTVVHVMAKVCEVLRWANAEGYTPLNPTTERVAKSLKFPTVKLIPGKGRGGLTMAQADRLVAAMPTYQDALVVRFMLATGARVSEVWALSVGCVDLDSEIPTVLFSHTMKGNVRREGTKGERGDYGFAEGEERQRVVIGDEELVAELREYAKGRPAQAPLFPYVPKAHGRRAKGVWQNPGVWRESTFNPVADALRAQGDFPAGVTPHWTRHTTASWLRHRFNNQSLVQVQMRHADERASRPYFHQTAENRAIVFEAMRKLRVA